MPINSELAIKILITIGVALIISFAATPIVKTFAQKVGAMDVPGEARRVHDHPIPRMGGLAIFLGFLFSVLLFADINRQMQGILLGCVIIVATGAIDDIISLNAWVKLLMQIIAAVVAVLHGVEINVLANPALWSSKEYLILGGLSVPITILWIVGITNSVNLIDGLDGLAVGVSTISSITMLVIALVVSDSSVAIVLAALVGACIGFMPYNLNPAKIFMGDTGALLLGYVLATMSILGLFKFYAVVSFAVPLLAVAVPLFDTVFAFCRRLFKGQSPFHADRGHFHHRLIDMGLSQKQAVAVLYSISGILGLAAVLITTSGEIKALIVIIGFCLCAMLWAFVYGKFHTTVSGSHPKASQNAETCSETSEAPTTSILAEDDDETN
ncbi:MAG: undecaprenyl/decaprenyl-phosphate alpha-N-acetylglucosaminyl 1-phosphate transferase [Oscillospiraceae bacterium]|nr:undecaprenyl/decaprenyl-phosphate alpha-N-acetylglucosaminyl 1-phosphate transferase [Oscillospiraceae bacterium]